MPTLRPTAKQQQVLDFIEEYIGEWGSSPTFREISKELGISVGTVSNFIKALEARECIKRNANESRSIQLVEK